VIVNGAPRDLGPATLARLLDALGVDAGRGVAVAVNEEVVPRGEWEAFEVPGDARVEIVTAVQGG